MLKNTRWEAFAQALAKGMSATAAYVAAGYRSHDGNAARLTGNERVRARVAELSASAIAKAEVTAERLIEEQAAIAFANIVDCLEDGPDGIVFKDPRSLPESLRRAISEITITGTGKTQRLHLKFWDKQRSLEVLMRHMQMFKDTLIVENVFQKVREMPDEELDRRIAELDLVISEGKGPMRH